MKKHQKHANLKKPAIGNFGRHEFAIMGTPCGNIKTLAYALIEQLKGRKTAYVDADHAAADQSPVPTDKALAAGANLSFTDKINYAQFNYLNQPNGYQQKLAFAEQDIVLINGNHFEGNRQLLVVDSKKPLEKKIDKINNPVAIIRTDDELEISQAINDKFPDIDILPRFHINEVEKIAEFIANQSSIAPLKGLVLIGGQSQRMQENKALIKYHGLPQYEHTHQLLTDLGLPTYLSVRSKQELDMPQIEDRFVGLGPFGAICSAFQEDPDAAWLVLACDLPLLDTQAVKKLIEERDPSKLATAFHNPATNFPDPLATIYEPKAYATMLSFLSIGYSCPRKVLINSDIKEINPDNPQILLNANTPEEKDHIQQRINGLLHQG